LDICQLIVGWTLIVLADSEGQEDVTETESLKWLHQSGLGWVSRMVKLVLSLIRMMVVKGWDE
jgi:hypothetical protein